MGMDKANYSYDDCIGDDYMKKIPKTIKVYAYTDDDGKPVCAGCLFDHNRPCWFSWRDRWEIYRPDAVCLIWRKQDDTGAEDDQP